MNELHKALIYPIILTSPMWIYICWMTFCTWRENKKERKERSKMIDEAFNLQKKFFIRK